MFSSLTCPHIVKLNIIEWDLCLVGLSFGESNLCNIKDFFHQPPTQEPIFTPWDSNGPVENTQCRAILFPRIFPVESIFFSFFDLCKVFLKWSFKNKWSIFKENFLDHIVLIFPLKFLFITTFTVQIYYLLTCLLSISLTPGRQRLLLCSSRIWALHSAWDLFVEWMNEWMRKLKNVSWACSLDLSKRNWDGE